MKKFLLTLAVAAVTLAASAFNEVPVAQGQLGSLANLKKATPEMVNQLAAKTLAARAPKKMNTPVTAASDLEGGYTWNYEMAGGWGEDPSTVETTSTGAAPVLFYDANDAAGTFKIAGMFDGVITAQVDLTSYSYPTFTLSDTDLAAITSNYGTCYIKAVFYYEGDSNNDAGWYYTDPMAFVVDGEIIWATDTWIFREIASGTYAGYYLTPLWKPGSTMEVNEAVNSIMTYNYALNGVSFDFAAAMEITQENYVATITNFAGLSENPVNITLEEGRTWTADHTALYTNTNGTYVLYGVEGESLIDLTGTGTETTLTFGSTWTGYDTTTNYWLGERGAATITLVGDEFIWPGEEEVLPESITLNATDEDEIILTAGQTYQLTATVVPEAADQAVTWSTSDEAVATVEDGLVTACEINVEAPGAIKRAPTAPEGHMYVPVTITATSVAKPEVTASVTMYVDVEVPTGINDVNAATVTSVKFVNAQGVTGTSAFDGVNIMITTLSDGTVKAVKIVK